MLVHACVRDREEEMINLASDTETIAFPKQTPCLQEAPND
jgi:hypothetical protein